MAIHETIPNATGFDELLAGPEEGILTKNIKLKSGTSYKRGMLISSALGEDGKTEVGSHTAKGGTAEYVLMHDVNATGAEAVGTVYVKGRFNREKIIVAAEDTVEAHESELRLRNIYFTTIKK